MQHKQTSPFSSVNLSEKSWSNILLVICTLPSLLQKNTISGGGGNASCTYTAYTVA